MQEKYDNNTTLAVDLKPDPDFLPFTNDFIFSLVMRDPTLCRELLSAEQKTLFDQWVTLTPSQKHLLAQLVKELKRV